MPMLAPGDNFVGWIADAIAVEDLFEAIPQVEVVCFWDAADHQLRFATPALPSASWTLNSIEPGMAVALWNGSEESVPWLVQAKPAPRGLVELHRGMNWVSWAGPSEWSIDDVARGIGQSVVRIKVGEQEYRPSRLSQESSLQSLLRGDPLVVEVSRDVRWLQPTGMLPKIQFFGAFTASDQRHHIEMVQEVVDFFGKNYGVEVAPSILEIWIFDSDTYLDDPRMSSEQREIVSWHIQLRIATGSATRIVTSAGTSRRDKSVLLHEYFHSLQSHLAGPHASGTNWMTEGNATWMEFKFDFSGNPNGWEYYITEESEGCGHTTLRAPGFGCEYVLGVLATKLLEETAGSDSIVEFWRQLAPQSIGPENRWESRSGWTDAFESAFNLSVENFYARFSAHRNTSTSRTKVDSNIALVEGYVRDDEADASPGVRVVFSQSSGVHSGYGSQAVTDAKGKFVVKVFAGEKQRIEVHPAVGCSYWLGESGATLSPELAKEFTFWNSEESPLRLQLPSELCTRRIEGTVFSPQFGPLEGVNVYARGSGNSYWSTTQRTRGEGRFTVTVPSEGSYSFGVDLSPGCRAWYRRGEAAGLEGERTRILVSDSDIKDIQVQVPPDLCVYRISGRLLNAYGAPMVGVEGHADTFWAETSIDGTFSITVPTSGIYHPVISISGCYLTYLGSKGLTMDRDDATLVIVSDSDVTGVEFRLPEDLSAFCH